MCRKFAYLVIGVFVLAFVSVSQAGLFDPPLLNPSFESPALPTGWDYYADVWTLGSRASAFLENGSWEIAASEGINVWKLWSGANVWQQIGTWDPDVEYAISLWVGRGHEESSLSVELWAGGDPSLVPTGQEDVEGPTGHYGQIDDANGVGATLIGAADLIPTVDVGQSEWMTAILNTGSDFTAGDALWLRLVSTAPDDQATWIDLVEVASAVVEISTPDELQAIGADETSLAGDYILVNDIDLTGFDWQRVGPFTGTFDGAYHTISGLTMDADRANLFSTVAEGGEIKNVGLSNFNIRGGWYVGALVGSLYGTVSNCFAVDGTVTTTQGDYGNVGTLIGLIRETGSVSDCYSTMDLILEGGGFSQYSGGFTGGVAGPATNCYFAGTITGDAGPFAGYINENLATSCYYDTDVTGILDGDLGRTTAEMMQEATYVGWDFAEIWTIDEGQGYPTLRMFPIAVPVPNGTFHMYKPGTDILGIAPDDIWVQQIGLNRPLSSSTPVPFEDGTEGLEIDCPGWITPIESQGSPTNTCDLFSLGYDETDGSSCLNCFGAWSGQNGNLAESAESLGNIESGRTYTLSAMLIGNAAPVTFELQAGGVALIPSSSVTPEAPGDWEVISRTYEAADIAAFVGQPMTIVVGTSRPGEGDPPLTGSRGRFDNISLSYVPVPVGSAMVPITIDNPGFEDPVLDEDDYTWLDVPGWTPVGGEGSGIWNVTSADFDPVVAPEGENVLYTENAVGDAGGVTQVLTDTFAADTDYTLTVEIGNSNYYYFSGYSVQLLAGGVVIAEDNDTLWPDYKTWATSTVEYTYDPADAALVGQPLEIRLLNLSLDKDNPPEDEVVGVEFDNVTLSHVR